MKETTSYKGFTITVQPDFDPESPREWSCLGTILHSHRNYNLGESIRDYDDDELKDLLKGAVVLPVFIYDHSGVTIWTDGPKTHPFDPQGWDSGQVGIIYASPETIRKEYGVKRITKQLREKVANVLRGEIETFDQYLRGEVYGYTVTDSDGESIDSCWGFYDEADMIEQAKNAIDCEIRQRAKKHFAKLRTWIVNRVPLDKRTPFTLAM